MENARRCFRLFVLCVLTGCHPHSGGPFVSLVAPQVSPMSLAFDGIGSSNAQAVTVSQAQYGGTFVASGLGCSGIATISPSSGRTFRVTPAGAGTCSFIFSDNFGLTVTLDVGVTTTAVTGS